MNRAMSNATGDPETNSNSSGTVPISAAKRAPAYRRSLSLEQSQNIKEIEVFIKVMQ